VTLSFDPADDVAAPFINSGARPRVAILREQGVNGHVEMAAAFDRAGFAAIDVHMSDILAGRVALADFKGAVACGGFSYGDVLGAGQGWAKTILFNERARDNFAAFFDRPDTFALGVCNGCQMMSALKEMIPGADAWPRLRAQPRRAVRSALLAGRSARVAVDLLCRHGRQPAAGGRLARRGTRAFCLGRSSKRDALVAMRYVDPARATERALSGQPERLTGRHHRPHHRGRPFHDHDAAPRTRFPQRPDVLAPRRLGRARLARFTLAAHVPQRAALGAHRSGRRTSGRSSGHGSGTGSD
jgi:hypothetical protein